MPPKSAPLKGEGQRLRGNAIHTGFDGGKYQIEQSSSIQLGLPRTKSALQKSPILPISLPNKDENGMIGLMNHFTSCRRLTRGSRAYVFRGRCVR
ncbi:uncharacterized protein PpBr36_09524 [Pyricularia pennisetigena]|uniref:uncharacterized protein n=1 Tax=Pyricularia pennisetigena TaxID=1578925 RepID=UPI00114F6D3F|nr:uncharacterized protein PpBr36_09524 [Pyricularia pennisetigena]TLS21993.1 hypothetical protein PpBr36_09524 [Pyricularia pennisetigena]